MRKTSASASTMFPCTSTPITGSSLDLSTRIFPTPRLWESALSHCRFRPRHVRAGRGRCCYCADAHLPLLHSFRLIGIESQTYLMALFSLIEGTNLASEVLLDQRRCGSSVRCRLWLACACLPADGQQPAASADTAQRPLWLALPQSMVPSLIPTRRTSCGIWPKTKRTSGPAHFI